VAHQPREPQRRQLRVHRIGRQPALGEVRAPVAGDQGAIASERLFAVAGQFPHRILFHEIAQLAQQDQVERSAVVRPLRRQVLAFDAHVAKTRCALPGDLDRARRAVAREHHVAASR